MTRKDAYEFIVGACTPERQAKGSPLSLGYDDAVLARQERRRVKEADRKAGRAGR